MCDCFNAEEMMPSTGGSFLVVGIQEEGKGGKARGGRGGSIGHQDRLVITGAIPFESQLAVRRVLRTLRTPRMCARVKGRQPMDDVEVLQASHKLSLKKKLVKSVTAERKGGRRKNRRKNDEADVVEESDVGRKQNRRKELKKGHRMQSRFEDVGMESKRNGPRKSDQRQLRQMSQSADDNSQRRQLRRNRRQ
jgi:hypothetical protein